MIEHVKLHGGPADGRKLTVKGEPAEVSVAPTPKLADPAEPFRRRREGKRICRYRRTDRGVGTGTIPKRYEYVP